MSTYEHTGILKKRRQVSSHQNLILYLSDLPSCLLTGKTANSCYTGHRCTSTSHSSNLENWENEGNEVIKGGNGEEGRKRWREDGDGRMSKEHDEGRWNLERDSIFFFPFFSNPLFSLSLSFLPSIYLFISYSYSYSVFVSPYVSSLFLTLLLSISFPLCLCLSVCLFLFQY